jgi:hypothetical protein
MLIVEQRPIFVSVHLPCISHIFDLKVCDPPIVRLRFGGPQFDLIWGATIQSRSRVLLMAISPLQR